MRIRFLVLGVRLQLHRELLQSIVSRVRGSLFFQVDLKIEDESTD